MSKTVKENLIAAKALIDTPEKWGKGDYETSPGCYCVLGAIAAATGHDPEEPWLDLPLTIRKQLKLAMMDDAADMDLCDYNDHPDTTHADIMALFDRAIAAQDASP